MKNFKNIILGIVLVLAVMITLPLLVQGSGSNDCNSICQDLCGDPSNSGCQITYCDGGSYLCTGKWQEEPE